MASMSVASLTAQQPATGAAVGDGAHGDQPDPFGKYTFDDMLEGLTISALVMPVAGPSASGSSDLFCKDLSSARHRQRVRVSSQAEEFEVPSRSGELAMFLDAAFGPPQDVQELTDLPEEISSVLAEAAGHNDSSESEGIPSSSPTSALTRGKTLQGVSTSSTPHNSRSVPMSDSYSTAHLERLSVKTKSHKTQEERQTSMLSTQSSLGTKRRSGMNSALRGSIQAFTSQFLRTDVGRSSGPRRLLGSLLRRSTYLSEASDIFDSQSMVNLLTFQGCEELQRASRLADILRCQASILAESKGSAESYKLSTQVEDIDAFVSHNWCVNRYEKYLGLCFYFNFKWASFGAMLLMIVAGIASGLGWLPVVYNPSVGHKEGYMCRLIIAPCFLMLFFNLWDFARICNIKGPSIFLDKTCIHQEDFDIQKRGIKKLGAFICSSKEMIILYTDVYLTKLWTVYEVAAFMSLHNTDKMKCINLVVPKMFFAAVVVIFAGSILDVILQVSAGVSPFLAVMPFCAIPYSIIVRSRAFDKERIRTRLVGFSIGRCTCFDPEDRPRVYKNIATLMRETQKDRLGCAELEVALDAFDVLVQSELPQTLVWSQGRYSVMYRHVVAIFGITRGATLLDALAGCHHGMSPREVELVVLYWVTWIFGAYPLILAFAEEIAGCCLHLRGWRNVLYTILLWMYIVSNGLVTLLVIQVLDDRARTSSTFLALRIAFALGLCLFAILLYSITSAMARTRSDVEWSKRVSSVSGKVPEPTVFCEGEDVVFQSERQTVI